MARRPFNPQGVWMYVPYPQGTTWNDLISEFASRGGRGVVLATSMSESIGYVAESVAVAHGIGLQAVPIVEVPTPDTADHWVYQEVRESECEAVLVSESETLSFTVEASRTVQDMLQIWDQALGNVLALCLNSLKAPGLRAPLPTDTIPALFGSGRITGYVYDNDLFPDRQLGNVAVETLSSSTKDLPYTLYWPTGPINQKNFFDRLLANARSGADARVSGLVLEQRLLGDDETFLEAVSALSKFPDYVPEMTEIIERPVGVDEKPETNELLKVPPEVETDSGSADTDEAESKAAPDPETEPEITPELDPAADISITPAAHRDTAIDCDTRDFEDTLGHMPYVSSLYQLLSHRDTGLPISIAVSAPWGSGKTSVMRWLKCEMDAHRTGGEHTPRLLPNDPSGNLLTDEQLGLTRRFKTVWVDAWRYEDGPALWAALTKAVYEQCQDQIDDSALGIGRLKFRLALANEMEAPEGGVTKLGWKSIAGRIIKRYASTWKPWAIATAVAANIAVAVAIAISEASTAWLAATAPGLLAALGSIGSVRGLVRQPFSFNLDKYATEPAGATPPSYSDQGAREIARMVRLFAPGENDAVAIFVDDLDRCSPNRVMDTLEAVNLLFNGSTLADGASSGKSAFVLGMDVDMVAASVRVAYRPMVGELRRRGNPAASDYGFRFLGKIVQLVFNIPPPPAERIAGLVETLVDAEEKSGTETGAEIGPEELPTKVREEYTERYEKIVRDVPDQERRAEKAAEMIETAPPEEKAAVDRHISDLFRNEARERARRDSKDVREAIQFGSALLEQRPRDIKRFVNAVRLQFLVMDQTLQAGKVRAQPKQVGKWTALVMRWPILAEEIRWSPGLVAELEHWAEDSDYEPEFPWPGRVQRLLTENGSSKHLREMLLAEPSLYGANLYGLLPVQ